jgi:molecular chaperone HtpG
MAGNKVSVFSRSWKPDEQGWHWFSEGAGGYEIEPAASCRAGRKFVVHLKEDAKEFAQTATIERIIKRYSSFVQFPIELDGKRLNTVQAIWARSKGEIKEGGIQRILPIRRARSRRSRFTGCTSRRMRRWRSKALLFVPSHNVESLGMSAGRVGGKPLLPQGVDPGQSEGAVSRVAALFERRGRQ